VHYLIPTIRSSIGCTILSDLKPDEASGSNKVALIL
jgi:hypothetical protein